MLGMGSHLWVLGAACQPARCTALRRVGGHQSHWHQPGPGDVESLAIININAFEYPLDLQSLVFRGINFEIIGKV